MAYEQIQNSLLREQEKRRMLQREMLKGSQYNPNAQVSGRSIPYSPIQGLTTLGKAWLQKKAMDDSDRRTTALNAQAEQGRNDAYGRFTDQYYGKDETLDQANMTTPQREGAQQANPVKAAMFAMQDPYLKDTGLGKAMMPAKDRGSYSRYVDYTDPETGVTRQAVFNTRAPAGMQLTELDGTPINTAGLSTKDAAIQGKASYAKAKGTAKGTDAAEAEIELPAAEARTDETVNLVEELINHPGMKDVVGLPDNPLALKGYMWGTDAADFKALNEQITGRTFMEIFPTLKGGGQITEVEGEKGQAAINRMKTASSEEGYKKAANDFIKEVNRLRNIVRQRAGVAPKAIKAKETLPSGVSEEDIKETMKIHGMTRQQVLDRLNQ